MRKYRSGVAKPVDGVEPETRYVPTGEARLVDLTSETRPADYELTGRLRCGPD
jgi:hypothetical protein